MTIWGSGQEADRLAKPTVSCHWGQINPIT